MSPSTPRSCRGCPIRPTSESLSKAVRKETACFQGATVTALPGRTFVAVKTRPRKAVTVAPKANIAGQLLQIDFSDRLAHPKCCWREIVALEKKTPARNEFLRELHTLGIE